MSTRGRRVLHRTDAQAARNLRNTITQRLQQVTECVTSQGFNSAFQEALANPTAAQYALSARNLTALSAPIPPGAVVLIEAPVSGNQFSMSIAVRKSSDPSIITFWCIYPPGQAIQHVDVHALLRTPSNPFAQRLQGFAECVTSQGFAKAFQEILGSHNPSQTNEIETILGAANLQALRVPIPPGCRIQAGYSAPWQAFCISLCYAPIVVNFGFPN